MPVIIPPRKGLRAKRIAYERPDLSGRDVAQLANTEPRYVAKALAQQRFGRDKPKSRARGTLAATGRRSVVSATREPSPRYDLARRTVRQTVPGSCGLRLAGLLQCQLIDRLEALASVGPRDRITVNCDWAPKRL